MFTLKGVKSSDQEYSLYQCFNSRTFEITYISIHGDSLNKLWSSVQWNIMQP